METPKTLTELRQRLGTGLDVNANVTSSTSDVTWSLLQATAISGSPDMVQLLLDRGADMKFLTHANKSVVDLACEAENWATFELLGKLADNRHSETHAPSPRFYPSKFYLDLQNPIDQEIHNISLIDFEDMITRSRNMSRSGDLANLVPYPSENPHLVGPFQECTHVASILERDGKLFERAVAYSKFWLFRCLKLHSNCRRIIPLSRAAWPMLPTRVLDVSRVQEGTVKLVDGFPRRSPYCALSYRWGHPTVTTTTQSIAKFRKGIDVKSLQTEIQDAFIVAYHLGIQYVWVDALCVIQKNEKDPGDWQVEAPKMEQVYGNATLTLAFTDSSRFGAVSGASFSKASSRDFGVLDTRGWAFQESLLSPRVLFITKNGLYWECLENSMSEKCPVGIPCPTDGFYAVDTRKIKMTMLQPMQQPKLDEASRERLLCMWRRGIVEEYTKRQLTFEEDRVMAAAGVTGRLRLVFDDICLVGVWKRDALRSLFWHAVEPSRRPKRMIFPSWSWYSVQGPVVYTTWTPFTSGATQPRAKLKDDMGNYRASIDDIVCKQDDVRSNVYWGQVILRGLGFKAFFSPGDGVSLYIPRRLGAEQELVEDLRRGRPNAAKHDAGPQPEHSYIVERARVDTLAFPGHKTYREVVCVVIVDNDNDGFPLALILEKVDADGDSHPGSARGMGEFLKRRLVPKQAGSSRGTRYERVGAVAIDTRMVHLKGHDAAMDHSDEMGWFGTFTII